MVKCLVTSALIYAAGTVGVGMLGGNVLIAGAINALISVTTGIVANDLGAIWDRVGKRLQGREAILRNDDLGRAVGWAV